MTTSIKDHYSDAIHQIMCECNISHPRTAPSYSVSPSACFTEVVQYTDWYIVQDEYAKIAYPNNRPHYRYNLYVNFLRSILTNISDILNWRIAHIDIGCGPGLFSWAFLDCMREIEFQYNNVNLYGYDHSEAMINLAQMIRTNLMEHIPDFPSMSYHNQIDNLLDSMSEGHTGNMAYVVTLGHVLANNHDADSINDFSKIISHIVESNGWTLLISTDASNYHQQFNEGWLKLLNNLDGRIRRRTVRISRDAKCVLLYRQVSATDSE